MALPISYNVRNLIVRWKVTLLAIVGIGLVVTVFVILLSMSSGFRLALRATGRPDNGIVVQRGSGSELTSWFTHEQANSIVTDPRVARGSDGQPLASPELVIVANMLKRETGQPTNVTVRAVTQKAFQVRTGVKIVQGRNFTPGLAEVIVGQRIQERMQGLDIGSKINIQKHEFTVVGAFTAEDGSFESEIWGDFDAMRVAFRRSDGQDSLTVRLVDAKTLPKFNEDIKADPRMQLEMIQERKYYEDQAGVVSKALLGLAGFVSFVMGIGAVFGAMNTMYAIVAARTREIGTLRALGFSRFLLSFALNGFTTGTGFTASFCEIAFAFHITPVDLMQGLIFALVMGIIGGLLPALRAAQLPITTALREA